MNISSPADRRELVDFFSQLPPIAAAKINSLHYVPAPVSGDADQLLTQFFNSSDLGIAILDRELRYLAINDVLAEINGIPAEEHLGRTVREGLREASPETVDEVERRLKEVLKAGTPVSYELPASFVSRPQPEYYLSQYFPIKDGSGQVKRVGVVVTDITEQKIIQQTLQTVSTELKEQRDRAAMLLDVNNSILANLELKTLFPAVSNHIRKIMNQDYASIALYEENADSLHMFALDFPLAKEISAPESYVPAKSGPAGRAYVEDQVKVYSREDLLEQRSPFIDRLLEYDIRSFCCIPLRTRTRTVGTLNLASCESATFGPKDLQLLTAIGSQIAIALENIRAHGEIERLKNKLAEEKTYLEDEIRSELSEEIIGESASFKHVLSQAKTVAGSHATVLLLGETGTGKELVARAIHAMSSRHDKTFVKINCAAIPTGLLESELFGHEKGAFTGAITQKIGRMELADRGTLFLDEVGEIPLELQPKLLRALQDQEFERLGSTRTLRVNTRIIAATNRDLDKAVSEGAFRRDLFYRLRVFPLSLPPLSERRDDIPLLVQYFVQKIARRMHKHIDVIPPEAMDALVRWNWPGNVRELENIIERSVILTSDSVLKVPISELTLPSDLGDSQNMLERMEREQIVRVLRETAGVIAGPKGAAVRLGLKRTTLQSRIQKLGIRRSEYES